MAYYRNMNAFKSFRMHFTTYKMDNYILSYVTMKLKRMREY